MTYPDLMFGGPEQPSFVNATVKATGIAHLKDVNGGNSNCVSMTPVVSICLTLCAIVILTFLHRQ